MTHRSFQVTMTTGQGPTTVLRLCRFPSGPTSLPKVSRGAFISTWGQPSTRLFLPMSRHFQHRRRLLFTIRPSLIPRAFRVRSFLFPRPSSTIKQETFPVQGTPMATTHTPLFFRFHGHHLRVLFRHMSPRRVGGELYRYVGRHFQTIHRGGRHGTKVFFRRTICFLQRSVFATTQPSRAVRDFRHFHEFFHSPRGLYLSIFFHPS